MPPAMVRGFRPAPELAEWIVATFLAEGSPLENHEHAHLLNAHLGCLWTNVPNKKHGQLIAATAELPRGQGGGWAKARAEFQLEHWFGTAPDFLLTFSAFEAESRDDASWCAL